MYKAYFEVTKEVEFDAGHRVPLHKSKCRNPHGHRYKVEATWRGPIQDEGSATGMVVDFGDLKAMLMEIHNIYDHGFIYQDTDAWAQGAFKALPSAPHAAGFNTIEVPFAPTAENLAREFFEHLQAITFKMYPTEEGQAHKIAVMQVRVFETPTSVATYGMEYVGVTSF